MQTFLTSDLWVPTLEQTPGPLLAAMDVDALVALRLSVELVPGVPIAPSNGMTPA
jgi:hypothetical protein